MIELAGREMLFSGETWLAVASKHVLRHFRGGVLLRDLAPATEVTFHRISTKISNRDNASVMEQSSRGLKLVMCV